MCAQEVSSLLFFYQFRNGLFCKQWKDQIVETSVRYYFGNKISSSMKLWSDRLQTTSHDISVSVAVRLDCICKTIS